jgi:hypothetical protein
MFAPLLGAVLAVSTVSSTAHAGSDGPYMWGVGPTISTIAFPGQFPTLFPKLSQEDVDTGNFDLDVSDKRRVTSLNEVGADASLGGRGVLYLSRDFRTGLRFHAFTLGKDYNAADFSLEFDKLFFHESKASAFFGGGLGFGTMRFSGDTPEDPKPNDGKDVSSPDLKLNTTMLRAHVGGLYRMKTSAVELGLFANVVIPGQGEFAGSYGESAEISGFGGKGTYWHGGLEATMYFGDFVPPKNKKSGGGKNKKKGGKKRN